jgi:glc operon protein GlcG
MYDRLTIGLDEAQRGVAAALDEATRRGLRIAIAVADDRGDLVAYAAQDAVIRISRDLSIQKAYTSAIGRRSSKNYAALMRERVHIPVELLLGPRATSSAGGIAIKKSDESIGGIGVSGASSAEEDEELCKLAIAAMGLSACS